MSSYRLEGQDIVYVDGHGITGQRLKEILNSLVVFAPTRTVKVNGESLNLWTDDNTRAGA